MKRALLLLPLLAAAVILPVWLLSSNSRAVQTPKMSLSWNIAGDTYTDTTNTMNVGAIQNCLVTLPGNNALHVHQADVVVQTVEDLVGWQGRFNYDGGKMRISVANFLPFTDNVLLQTVSFNNLPIDAGIHRDLTTATNIPPAAPGPQTALIGGSYLGTQTFPVSPDTPAKAVPDDTSYSAPTGGVLARVVMQVLAGNGNAGTIPMDLGAAPNPSSNVVIFNGTGTTTITLTPADLSSFFHAEGADVCTIPATPTATPTATPAATPTPTPTATAARTPTATPAATPTRAAAQLPIVGGGGGDGGWPDWAYVVLAGAALAIPASAVAIRTRRRWGIK